MAAGARPGARIPRDLWQLAIDLADRYGVSRVLGVVQVGYYEYQKQCRLSAACVNSARPGPQERVPRFIELPRSSGPTSTPANATEWIGGETRECMIEIEHVSGHRLRLRLPVANAAQITLFVRQLLEAR